MNKEEENKIFEKVAKLKGVKHQDLKLKEELSELLTENIRLETGRNKPNSKELIGEQADSIIMIEQWLYNHNEDFNCIGLSPITTINYLNFHICLIINDECCEEDIKHHIRLIYSYITEYSKENNTQELLYIEIERKLKKLEQRILTNDLL